MSGKVEMPLVEREHVFEKIDDMILHVQYAMKNNEEGKKGVLNIYGNSGYGKSYLRKGYDEKYLGKEAVAFYDFEEYMDEGVDDILYSWAVAILADNQKYQFELFAYTYDKYQELMRRQKNADLKRNLKGRRFVGVLWNAASGIVDPIGIGKKFLADIGKEYLSDVPEKLAEVKKKFGQHRAFLKEVDDCRQEEIMRELLLIAFVKDMELNLKDAIRPMIFFLDTYESYTRDEKRMKRYTEEWLKKVISSIDGVVWVISGREKIEWKEISFVKHIEMEKIQKEVSFERIFSDEKIAIHEEEHRKYIKDKSEGYPRVLDNYINEYLCMRDNGTIELEKLTGKVATVVKYIESGLDENAKTLLHILALFQDWPDQNIIREILGTEIHALQYVGEFETLLKKNVIKEKYMEKEMAGCIRGVTSFELKKNIFHKLVCGEYSDEYQQYIFEKTFEMFFDIAYCKAPTEKDLTELEKDAEKFERELIEQLRYDLEFNLIAFERRYSILWKHMKCFSEEIQYKIAILSRIYLNRSGVNLALIEDDKECQIIELVKTEKDFELAFELGYVYVDMRANEYAEKIVDFLQEECGDKSYVTCLRIRMLMAENKYREGMSVYREYKKEQSNKNDACYYRNWLEYVNCLRMFGNKRKEAKEIWALYCELEKEENKGNLLLRAKEMVTLAEEIEKDIRIGFAKEEYEKISELMNSENHSLVREKKNILADIYKECNMFKEAIELYQQLLSDEKGQGRIFYVECCNRLSLSYCYVMQGMFKEARNNLELKGEMLRYIEAESNLFIKSRLMARYSTLWFDCICNKGKKKPSNIELKECYELLVKAKELGEEDYGGPNYKNWHVYNYLVGVKYGLKHPNWKEEWEFSKKLVKTYYGEASTEYMQTINLFGVGKNS